jgi:outer membrane protein insertion porin family
VKEHRKRSAYHCAARLAGALTFAVAWLLITTVALGQEAAIDTASRALQLDEPADLGALADRPIRGIEVVQRGRWRSNASIQSVRVGEPLTAAAARRAAAELLATGGFADVVVFAEPLADGAKLRFEAIPRRLIATRRLVGAAFEPAEVWRDADLSDEDELTEAGLEELADRVVQTHRDRGYPNAKVSVETRDTDDAMKVVLIVQVEPGPPMLVANRVFVVPEVSRAALEEVVQSYEVGRGDRLDETSLVAADAELQDLLRARRYPQARVQHKTLTHAGASFVYVYVDPGALIRFRFEGNERFDGDQLTDVIDYDKETDRAPAALGDKVQSFYRSVGMLDATVTVEQRGRPTDAINEIVFHIREGDVVQVISKSFPCLRGGPRTADELRNELDGVLAGELPGGDLFGTVDPEVVDQALGPTGTTGARPSPLQPDPRRTYDAAAYDKVVKHVRDLYRSEGYLSATVGPVQVARRTCHRNSPAGQCVPLPFASQPTHTCRFDPRGLPVEDPLPDPRLQCKPDRAQGIRCEPLLWLYIPVKLGPQATLYDVAFEGNRAATEASLLEVAELEIGEPASNLQVEQARRRIVQAYRELGYAYAEVRATLDLSPDHTRARARFIINESQQVIVDRIVVVGAERTSESLIRGRVALKIDQPYRASDVRKTEERIATLGTFASVSVSLQDPYVPARRKTVVIQVQERVPQYLDIRPGFSTGEGFRIQFEYGHLNIAGEAIRFTLRLRLSYLPDPFILDDDVRTNLNTLPLSQRLERHNTASVLFPEVGLGPLISLGVDGIDVRSNARDFGLSKNALSTSLNFRPFRTLTTSIGGSLERNDVSIFGDETVLEYLQRPGVTSDLQRLLLAPDGLTIAVAQLATVSWDRRDNPLGATRGTLLSGAVEHVRAFPGEDNPTTKLSDFMRVSGIMSGYVRLSKGGFAFAGSVRAGRIMQLIADSETYPDRLFFLGGVDSLRGFLRDSVVPQDVAERILDASPSDPNRLTISQVAIRGGDVFINPRAELRIPLTTVVHTTLFMDSGNLWVEPEAFEPWKLRYAAGSGLRVTTPIGPVAFDYGINLDRRPWEDFGAFHFSIGLF